MLSQYGFYFLSFVAIFCAILVVVSKNPIHSCLYLILAFFAIAGHYFLLNAQFLFAVHIIVYAGAIMVLFLYVIMMLNLNQDTEPNKSTFVKIAATFSGGLLMLALVVLLKGVDQGSVAQPTNLVDDIGLIEKLGKSLYYDYLLPFEISAILFLSSMVGAVYLGKKEII
jgi:NADH-quinone oxidoreductase subunit J